MARRSHHHYVNTLRCFYVVEWLVYANNLRGPYESAKLDMMCEMKRVIMYGFDGKLALVLSLLKICFQVF